MFVTKSSAHDGYIFLVSILILGTIAMTVTLSMLLLSISAEQNGQTVAQSGAAFDAAQTCIERAIRSLRADPTYAGRETISVSSGATCEIKGIGSSGNYRRSICAEGRSGSNTRRIEAMLNALRPSVRVRSWREVPTFTLCL